MSIGGSTSSTNLSSLITQMPKDQIIHDDSSTTTTLMVNGITKKKGVQKHSKLPKTTTTPLPELASSLKGSQRT